MMRHFGRMPYHVHPEGPVPGRPILLFLHGAGEGFVSKERTGHENLFQQGPPKHLPSLSAGHLLRASFTLIAPQLPDRDTPWSAFTEDMQRLLAAHHPGERLYVMGFSKGGLGAFQVAGQLEPAALVAIDASPMTTPPEAAVEKWVRPLGRLPFWAIHTTYPPTESLHRVQQFNELAVPQAHRALSAAPRRGEQARTCLDAPSAMTPAECHVWVCDEVTTNEAAYRWLLAH
jgi:hypothetical protein